MQQVQKAESVGDQQLMASFEQLVLRENKGYSLAKEQGESRYAELQTACAFEGFKLALGMVQSGSGLLAVDGEKRLQSLIAQISNHLAQPTPGELAGAVRH